MAVFPMEQRWYTTADPTTRHSNVTFLPTHPPEGTVTAWTDVWRTDSLLILMLNNMSLASLAMLALLEVPESTPNKLLSQLRRLLVRVGLCHIVLVNLMKTVVGVAFMVWTTPLMMPCMVLFWATSILAKVYYALRWGRSAMKAEGLDCVWGVEDEMNRPYITACLLLRGAPSLHWVQTAILTKVVQARDGDGAYRYRKFRQLFSKHWGYYCWRDDPNFDIRNHVRQIKLSRAATETAAGDDTDAEEAADGKVEQERSEAEDELVQKYVSEELMEDIPANMAPWEVLLVAREDGRYNVVLRIHHAIGDGVSLVRLCVDALVDTELPSPPVGPPPPSPLVKAARMMWSLTVLPLGIMKLMANFDRNSLHGAPLSGRKVMTWSKGMPLSVIRQVRAAASTTVNDVLMTCLSAALAKHFARRKEEDIQKVTVVVPVSFHEQQERHALTNLFSIATVKLPVAGALKPPARLAAVKKVMDDMKTDPTLWAVHFLVKAGSEVMPAPVASLMFNSRGLTLAASNVPGPQQEITIWGDEVEDLVFWVPNRGPVGVGVSFFSYKGVVKVGLNVDRAFVPSKEEAQQLLEDMEDELRLLHSRLVPQAA